MLWSLVLGASLLTACTIPDHGGQAQALAQRYYDFLKEGQFAEAAALFPPGKREQQLEILQDEQKRFGDLQDYRINSVETNTVYSGKFYIFITDTRYEKTAAGEILTLLEKVNDDKLYIVFQKVDPDQE
ncbi:MAG: hypothetical protein ACE5ET_06615 [Gammaproteobacteria bacterium]